MLNGKRIVITGAAGVLGQAVAATAHQFGADVVGLDIVKSASLPGSGDYYAVDLLNRAETCKCLTAIGDFDAILNIAGGFAMGSSAADPSDEEWNWMFDINVQTLRNAVIGSVPVLKRQERSAIVNVGAMGAVSGLAAMSAYSCAKSAVMRLTESLSEELKNDGINVNAVLPSIIDTPGNRHSMPDADFETWVTPNELANVMCFLASDGASAVHGVLMPVKGLT